MIVHYLFRQYGIAFEGSKPLVLNVWGGVHCAPMRDVAQGVIFVEVLLFCSSVSDLIR